MLQWEDRPPEVASLLNPAFCGEVLLHCVAEYEARAGHGLAYELSFLILPIVLHKHTRDSINPRGTRLLHVWLQQHPDVKIDFAERAKQLVPITRESIMFLLKMRALSMDEHGSLRTLAYRKRSTKAENNEEILDCLRKAEIIGRWFARAGEATTVYTMWGVRP